MKRVSKSLLINGSPVRAGEVEPNKIKGLGVKSSPFDLPQNTATFNPTFNYSVGV